MRNRHYLLSRLESNCLLEHRKGMRAQDIASMFNVPVNTVYVSIARANKKLANFEAKMLAFARKHGPYEAGQ